MTLKEPPATRKNKITVHINSHLEIKGLSSKWIEGLAKAVSFENESKRVAKREHVWGAKQMDDLLTLAEVEGDTLRLPRGFKNELQELLENNGRHCSFTQWIPGFHEIDLSSPNLRPNQKQAIGKIIANEQGRIIMPTGEGKTVVGLGAIARIKKPTLILVDKSHIAKQWKERAEEHIEYSPGIIGDKEWDEKPISIALLQTLRSRQDQLDTQNWWNRWAFVIFDEQHHVPAETYLEIIQKFPAQYRIGLSATIGKSKAKKRISELIFGPIIYESKEQRIKPEIRIIETDFKFDFHSTMKVKEGKKTKIIRNNYAELVNQLVDNKSRNLLIAKNIYKERDHANLIVSRRLAHLNALEKKTIELGFNPDRCWMLTGKESSDERMEIYKLADEGNCAIFSTVADEALDIPRLDRLHMVFPQRNIETIKQQLGRLTREHSDKEDALAYDYVDVLVDIIKGQFSYRLRNLYQVQELTAYKISA